MNPFSTLGVTSSASLDEIRTAYRKKAILTHPDRHPDDPSATARFQQLNEAYNILIDPSRRSQFEQDISTRMTEKEDLAQRAKLREDFKRKLNLKEKLHRPPTKTPRIDDIIHPSFVEPVEQKGVVVQVTWPMGCSPSLDMVKKVLSKFGKVSLLRSSQLSFWFIFPNRTSVLLAQKSKLMVNQLPLDLHVSEEPTQTGSDLGNLSFSQLEALFFSLIKPHCTS
ncbi:hypothetical protein P9112_007745 [Eukaryota sp. TZLM1-RC]